MSTHGKIALISSGVVILAGGHQLDRGAITLGLILLCVGLSTALVAWREKP